MSRRDDVDIDGNVETYLGARVDTARYSSFDYCFNYFRDFHDTGNVDALTDAGHLELLERAGSNGWDKYTEAGIDVIAVQP